MSNWVHRTMIVPAALVQNCRQLAASIPGGAGMWLTGLSPDGNAPATHYISAGQIMTNFAAIMDSPNALSAATGVPLVQAQTILDACSVSSRKASEVLQEMGLQVVEAIDEESAT